MSMLKLLSPAPRTASAIAAAASTMPDYGIDAPVVRRSMLAAGIVGAAFCRLSVTVTAFASGAAETAAAWFAVVCLLAALYGLGMGAYMTHWSRIGKLRTRERLLNFAGDVVPWTGREMVLDVGCGRGLMLVGAARRLNSGIATGIDLWRSEDQADNSPDATLENARREGVADRVRVETGDARALPFADASFDAVVSHWVIHNLPEPADRTRALNEMLRVLRPGGVLVLADIAHHRVYRAQLEAHGLIDILAHYGGWETRLVGVLSGGSFRPHALVGRRAE
ncbi:methyltransferase type 11 [Methylobacterium fujisawaense]|uniref:class I SAM-dependent methyltransferase n=1 Tax=Methylobacterium fujisawaense TaxID=107400 RepID=UPI002F2FD4BE